LTYSVVSFATNGNVGIGKNNPQDKLDVKGGIKAGNMDVTGKVGIGTTDPITSLEINSGGDADIRMTNFNDGSYWELNTRNSGRFDIVREGLTYNVVSFATNGNVGIGKNNPQDKLHVNGNVRANGFPLTSDARWKENIEPIEDPLDLVTQLRGVSYDWINATRGEGRQIGVIAQEVEGIFPEVVHTDSQGYKSVEYSKLVAPLIEAVKVLKDENDLIRAENENLKNKLEDQRAEFENRMSEIEKMLAVLKYSPVQ
jgi:hypothetical protein